MSDRPTAAEIAQQQASARQIRDLEDAGAGLGKVTFGEGHGDRWRPPQVGSIEDTGLNLIALSDLALKILYFGGYMSGYRIAEIMRLPFTGIVDQIVEFLKREKWVEVKGTGGIGEGAFQYLITGGGTDKAREVLDRSQYAGPAPVTLEAYSAAIRAQHVRPVVNEEVMQKVLNHLIVGEKIFQKIGPAVNSGRSIFLYGPPGTGKTTIAEAIGNLVLGRGMYIPYAIDIDGQVVRVFDSVNHEIVEDIQQEKTGTGSIKPGEKSDPRWIRIRRPVIIVGGELTMAGLDLVYDETNKYYEAPFQVKANGGMFLIDDFGRQQVRPRDLLNRWIVPLEKRVDYLTLHTGRKLEVPFDVLIVFSTNLEPRDLVDEAFLRRIRHKIEIGDPSFEDFREIFQRVCYQKGMPYDEKTLAYLLQEWYIKQDRKLRAVHPRDLIDQIIDISSYLNIPLELSKEMLDRACEAYFVEI
jgi:hypothetical protein